jgi:hypothetical protein
MNRPTVLLVSCLAIAGSAWLAHVVWGQAAEAPKEKTFTITQSQLDKYVGDRVAKAVAVEREKGTRDKPATDEEVHNPENWHIAIFNQAEYVVYTGPGQFMFHHWVEPAATKPPAGKSGAPAPSTTAPGTSPATKPPAGKSSTTLPVPKGG